MPRRVSNPQRDWWAVHQFWVLVGHRRQPAHFAVWLPARTVRSSFLREFAGCIISKFAKGSQGVFLCRITSGAAWGGDEHNVVCPVIGNPAKLEDNESFRALEEKQEIRICYFLHHFLIWAPRSHSSKMTEWPKLNAIRGIFKFIGQGWGRALIWTWDC